MPDGSGHVPTYLQQRWYPRMRFQQNVMHDITLTGPFSYKDELKSTVLTCKYKFKFLWGGNLIPQQVVRNPCKSDGRFDIDPHRFPRELQIADPRTMGPQWVFHTWDFRRGLYGKDAIKRVSEKPDDDELYTFFPKKPRLSTPAEPQASKKRLLFPVATKKQHQKKKQKPKRNAGATGAAAASPQTAAQTAAAPRGPAATPISAGPQNPSRSPPKPTYIGPCINKVYMFPESKPRTPTAQDWAQEYEMARIFDRPARSNLSDTPFYPWVPKPFQCYFCS